MKLKKTTATLLLALFLLPLAVRAELLNNPANYVQFQPGVEIGLLGVLSHTIQLSKTGTMFDYVKEGNQNLLFPYRRLTADLSLGRRHNITFLYQPLDVRTEVLLERDVTVDSLTFPARTALDLRYGFDFYRVSYCFDLLPDPEKELALGLSLQMRDATISFAAKDGTMFRVTQNVGPVPILKARVRWPLGGQSWLGAEIDGFYASDQFLNGANFKFEGSILDASVRYGLRFSDNLTGFINWRYLGGSAKGQGYDTTGPSDGYTDNRLGTYSLSLGFYLR